MKSRFAAGLLAAAALTVGAVGLAWSPQLIAAPRKAASADQKPGFMAASRRLTESQYRNTIADIFGPDIKVNGRFEPERRDEGLLAIADSKLSISAAGFEQYYSMAKSISDQAFDDKHRARFTTCQPADPKAVDPRCVDRLVRDYGLKLFRRPLSEPEVKARVAAAVPAGNQLHDHNVGMKLALTSLLTAPEFLFRIETAEPDPAQKGQMRLDGYTKAARLSYLMWDTTPDAELLRAAATGELHDAAGLKVQVDRLTASKPRIEVGARAFFGDMLQLDGFETLTKDATVYPKFSAAYVESAREQTLKTFVDLLVTRDGDYRDVFTSRETFLNRLLASVYQVPYVSTATWTKYTVPADHESAGVITQATFMALFSHPGRTSPTKRGVALNEIFLCSPTPTPPADVDFSKVRDSNEGTVRGRLNDHMNNPGCAGCHKVSDPIGLSLERFDSIGQPRTLDNGKPIDVSAELSGKKFEGATGLGQYLHDNPRAPSCLVRNVYAYGVGRAPEDDERYYLKAQSAQFAANGYRYTALLAQIALSEDFFKVVAPKPEPQKDAPKAAAKVAKAQITTLAKPAGGIQ